MVGQGLVGDARYGSGGETVTQAFIRILTALSGDWPVMFSPTAFDVGRARLAAIDLAEVAPQGSAEADRQAAAFYLLARHALTRHWWITEDGEGKPLVFRDTMISNVRDLVDVVPRLNIFGDDRLAQLCQEVKDRIAHADPATLRPSPDFNPNVRRQVKRDADALKEKFAGYFGTPAVDREAA